MRFREQKEILEDSRKYLSVNLIKIENNLAKIDNAAPLIGALHQISKLGIIDEEIEMLKEMSFPFDKSLLSSHVGPISFHADSDTYGGKLVYVFDIVRLKVDAVIASINLSLPEQEDDSTLVIGLPEIVNFDDLSPILSKLSKSLTMIVGNEKIQKNEIKFKNFDSGSSWIEIAFLAGPPALYLVAAAIDVCAKSAFRWQQHKFTCKAIEKLDYDEKIKQEILTQLKEEILDDIKTAYAQEIGQNTETDYDLSEEYLNRAKKGITMLTDLMEDGTTFQAAKKNLEYVRKTFPSLKEQKKLSEPIVLNKQEKIENEKQNTEEETE